jgi:hypothetical protein
VLIRFGGKPQGYVGALAHVKNCRTKTVFPYRFGDAPSRSHMTGHNARSRIAVNVQLDVIPGSSLTLVQPAGSFAGYETHFRLYGHAVCVLKGVSGPFVQIRAVPNAEGR